MGGPCYLVDSQTKQKSQGPACTDNFQYIPFQYAGKLWHSVEQAFQAQKFTNPEHQEIIRNTLKTSASMSDSEHGNLVWQQGRRVGMMRADWDKVKIDYMYETCLAKLESNPQLKKDLLATGSAKIVGGPSTGWDHPKMGHQNWGFWNGLIQMKCREMCKENVAERNQGLIQEVDAVMKEYKDGY